MVSVFKHKEIKMRVNKLLTALAVATTLGLSATAFAVAGCSGIYVGGQAGYTRASYDLNKYFDKHFDKDGYAGRIYLGYQFNAFLGLETGLAMLSEVDMPKHFGDVSNTHWDMLVKAGAPLGESGFRADVKAGGVHVMSHFDTKDVAKSLGLDDVRSWKIRPVAGASVSYALNQNIAVDLTYFHVFGDPKHNSFSAPNVDMAMLGVSYLFANS